MTEQTIKDKIMQIKLETAKLKEYNEKYKQKINQYTN